jgi:putative NADH-flavin reductase
MASIVPWRSRRPSAELKPGERTGKFPLGNDQLFVDATGQSKISVQDYTVAMIDELERPTHVRQRFTVGYGKQGVVAQTFVTPE